MSDKKTVMEIEGIQGEKLLSVQFYYDEDKLSDPISLFKSEIEKRKSEYQNSSKGIITYKVLLDGVIFTKDNIHLYYEFMSDEDVSLFGKENIYLAKLHDERFEEIILNLNLNVRDVDVFRKSFIHSYYFETKDTLKPIDEYIADIRSSDKYKEYKQSVFLKNGKSEPCSRVLQLMDEDWSYLDARNEALIKFPTFNEEDLEIELDIYC